MMNDFSNEPSEGATSSLLAQKTLLERVTFLTLLVVSKNDEITNSH